MTEPIHIISLGAGVQSSAMALMLDNHAFRDVIFPKPKFGVFADTGDEPTEVYAWLEKLKGWLSFPIHTVKSPKGKLSENILLNGFSQIPAFRIGEDGKVQMGKRQCTNHWKIRPITHKIREVTETKHKRLEPDAFHVMKGISTDEISRVKPSRERSQIAEFPLIANGFSRTGCDRWLREHGYGIAPKSACEFCPLRSDEQWRHSKRKGGKGWDLIVAIDQKLRSNGEYLHRTAKPIEEIDFNKPIDDDAAQGQLQFNNECEGMCGV